MEGENTFMLSNMAPQSLLRMRLGCVRAWLTPRRMSPIRMDIWATPARHTSSCSCQHQQTRIVSWHQKMSWSFLSFIFLGKSCEFKITSNHFFIIQSGYCTVSFWLRFVSEIQALERATWTSRWKISCLFASPCFLCLSKETLKMWKEAIVQEIKW